MQKIVHWFEPNANPVRGMRSSPHRSALPLGSGYFPQITNLRFTNTELKVRQGMKKLTSAIPTASGGTLESQLGAWAGWLQGTYTIVAAYRFNFSGNHYTLLFKLNPSTFAWTEITHDGTADAKLGNTRFPGAGKVSFALVRDGASHQVLIAQNGVDSPRVYDPSATVHEQVAIHSAIALPSQPPSVTLSLGTSVPLYENGTRNSVTYAANVSTAVSGVANNGSGLIRLTVGSTTGMTTGDVVAVSGISGGPGNGIWTITVIDGSHIDLQGSTYAAGYIAGGNVARRLGLADSGLIGGLPTNAISLHPVLSIPITVQTNDEARIVFDFAASLNLTTVPQLLILFSTTFTEIWNQVKIVAYDTAAAHNVTVWDPTASLVDPVYVTDVSDSDPNMVLAGFSLSALKGSTNPAATACKEIGLFWVGTAPPSANETADLYMIACSGQVPGGMSYAVSWMNSSSRAESAGQIIGTPAMDLVQNLGGSPADGIKLPFSSLVYYVPTVYVPYVSNAQIQTGVDTVRLYRQDDGEFTYSLAASYVVATFTLGGGPGSWSSVPAGASYSAQDTCLEANKDPAQTMPDGFHQPIPIGSAMTINGGRLFVGGVNSSQVWVSDGTSPFKFRTQVRFLAQTFPDPTSPTRVDFDSQPVTALWQGAGSHLGVSPVYVFTASSVWRLDGVDVRALSTPTRVSMHGCTAGGSVAEHFGQVYYLDSQLQVRSLASGDPRAISYLKVDDKLASYDLSSCTAAVMQDRYYLACSPTLSGANSNFLVSELLLGGEWCEDVLGAGDAATLLQIDTLGQARTLYAFASTGHVYQVEAPGQSTDDGAAIGIVLTTPEVHAQMWQRINRGKVGVACDTGSAVITVTSTWQPAASGTDGTISLANASGSRAWLWETATDGAGQPTEAGGEGISVQVTLSTNLPSAFQFYSVVMYFEALTQDGAGAG